VFYLSQLREWKHLLVPKQGPTDFRVIERAMERSMRDISLRDRIPNEEIRRRTNVTLRWTKDIKKIAGGDWYQKAQVRNQWKKLRKVMAMFSSERQVAEEEEEEEKKCGEFAATRRSNDKRIIKVLLAKFAEN